MIMKKKYNECQIEFNNIKSEYFQFLKLYKKKKILHGNNQLEYYLGGKGKDTILLTVAGNTAWSETT